MTTLPLTELSAINPLDGRYRKKIEELSNYLSEYSLIKFRLEVEIKYLLFLSENKIIRKLLKKEAIFLESLVSSFSLKEAQKIKEIENETRHDIKAVEKYLREKFKKTSLSDISEYIHFGLTSEDINNISQRLMLKGALEEIIIPQISMVNQTLKEKSNRYRKTPMMARTHGQNAVGTTFGKEIFVFYSRLDKEIKTLKKIKLTGKLNGAVGNFNSLYFVFPQKNWISLSKKFVLSLGLEPNLVTTQINSFEDIIAVFQTIERINGILIDFDQDMWRYISDGWLKLAVKDNEVGSSTMPQKVNPIDYENSEGNLIIANGLSKTMSEKLYVSRLQRDLSNSTVIRNMGSFLGYCLLGYKSILSGLSRIDVNEEKMAEELNKDWSILTEALQTYLRNKKFNDSYYFVSSFSKGKKFDEKAWFNLINKLEIPDNDKRQLLKLTPSNYIGLAEKIVLSK